MRKRSLILSLAAASTLVLSACNRTGGVGSAGARGEDAYGKYLLHGTFTDDANERKAKENADAVLVKLQSEANLCLIGLWQYNPPALLRAVAEKNKLGKVKVVGFDEHDDTLKGIKDGHMFGTVVQDPYGFGYESVKLMTELVKKGGAAPAGGKIKVAFISNNPFDFWTIAEAGTKKAADELGVEVLFRRPHVGDAAVQKEIIDALLVQQAQAIAVSVIDPLNQTPYLNKIAAKVPLITQDNDAPQSKRLAYIGTDNYSAGRDVGKLVKLAMPDGGRIAIFVGQMDPLNAQERRQGVLDELADKPLPEKKAAGEGKIIYVPHRVVSKEGKLQGDFKHQEPVEEFHETLKKRLGK